jgi:tryptophan-rich sensory protein
VKDRYSAIAFLVLVVGGGLVIGSLTPPDDWYQQLVKPSFNPPGWVFAPVWTLLYIAIAIAGWRTWERDRGSQAMKLWWAQLALNFAWSPLFFGAHQIGLAVGVIALLLVAVVAFTAQCWQQDRTAAWLFMPYCAWVVFAAVLNGEIWALN